MNEISILKNQSKRQIDTVVIHCSDSDYGNAALIDRWHKQRGWSCIGYHFVILNCYTNYDRFRLRQPEFWKDGIVETGRPVEKVGAHVKGHNRYSIGVCLIGKDSFNHQQFHALTELLNRLQAQFPGFVVRGHYELLEPGSSPKTCPNIDMDWLRALLTAEK